MILLNLEITDFYTFTHLGEAARELFYQIHLYIKIDGKIGVLMRGVDRSADVEVDPMPGCRSLRKAPPCPAGL